MVGVVGEFVCVGVLCAFRCVGFRGVVSRVGLHCEGEIKKGG